MKAESKNNDDVRSCISGLPRRKRHPSRNHMQSSNCPTLRRRHLTALVFLSPAAAARSNLRPHRNAKSLNYVTSASKGKTSAYPYLPSYSADTCTATRAAETWETSSSTLDECCSKSFSWQIEVCVMKGQQLEAQQPPEEEEDDEDKVIEYRYTPDWAARTCYNDKPPANDWVDQFNSLKKCCEYNFDWVLDECMGVESSSGLDPDRAYWYPLFSKSKCLLHSDNNPAPDYMLQNPSEELYPTFRTCCQSSFPDEMKECKLSSRLDLSPTRPPASDSTLVIVPISFRTYYYPRYTENKCLYNGEEAPNYMKKDAVTYLSLSLEECCEVQFPLNWEDCLYNSGGLEEDVTEEFNEERWRDHYYPVFNVLGCTNDNEYDDYMKESPTEFFFTTIELCCSSSNFESEDYETCLAKSINVNHVKEMEQQSSQVQDKVPILTLDFGGRLYFQNVFIPSGNRVNMIAVRNAILYAIEGVFQASQYTVQMIVAKNFDGIDLSGLRLLKDQGQSVETPSSRHGHEERHLGKIQLFSFVIQFTIKCSSACGRDGKVYGRQESLKIGEIFDDAIRDESIFNMLKSSMEEQGLIGPFYSAKLNDGLLLYEKAEMNMNGSTFTPTAQPSIEPSSRPTTRPTLHPTKLPTSLPTKPPSSKPTFSLSPTEGIVYQFYPNMQLGTCVADGKHTKWEINFYKTLEECCKFPWLKKNKCIRLGSKPPTSGPTRYPTKAPIREIDPPTQSPSKFKSQQPTIAPITKSPTQSPMASSPSKMENVSTSTTTTATSYKVETTAPVSSSPTKRLTSRPTLEPCDNKWHVSVNPDEIRTCTNSLDYPNAWESNPHLKAKMLLDTPDECCDNNFEEGECKLVYVCGDSEMQEPETPSGDSCDSLWHLSLEKEEACSNNDNIRAEWPSKMFYTSGEACCQKHFGKTCELIDDCPTSPPDNPSSPNETCDNPWHVSTTGAKNTCTNDMEYPDAWKNPAISANTLFDTADRCCDKFFKNTECHLIDVCATSTTLSTASSPDASPAPTPSDEPEGCLSNYWHVSTDGKSSTCTNDKNFPSTWLENEHIKKTQLFPSGEVCCDRLFSDSVCHREDVCTGETRTSGFYPVFKWPGCTNDDKAPDYMKGETSFFFQDIDSCCSSSNFDMADYNLCLENSVDVGPMTTTSSSQTIPATSSSQAASSDLTTATTTSLPPGDCDKSWHIATTGAKDTCTNDMEYPASWNMPQLAKSQLFETADACCQKYFASKPVCNKIDTCPPDDSSSSSNESPEEDSSSSNIDVVLPPEDCDKSWHIATTGATDTCTNDKEYPSSWNMPQLAKTNLFETADACCQKYFANKPVCNKINTCPPDDGSSSSNEETHTSTSLAATTTTSSSTTSVEDEKNLLMLDWEDEIIPDIVKFEGTGKWRIDETQPCCRTGVAIHNQNLLPGEYTSMIIEYTVPPGGGEISFDYNMGLGGFDFLINDKPKLRVAVPGGGLKVFKQSLEAGDYKFTWKYGAPPVPNLPLSAVWIDNIQLG